MDNNKIAMWLLGALLIISVGLGSVNLAMTLSRLDRIESRQDSLVIRLNDWYSLLAERLARIEGKINE